VEELKQLFFSWEKNLGKTVYEWLCAQWKNWRTAFLLSQKAWGKML